MIGRITFLSAAALMLVACAEEEPPPRTVTEFEENPILLEAAIVRCSRNREQMRYDQECMNAREAVRLLQAKEDETRRAELEARSEAKRAALRRRQEAQAEARRIAEEEQRRREEAEYLAQFGLPPPAADQQTQDDLPEGNVPLAVVPAGSTPDKPARSGVELPAGDGSNAPVVEISPPDDATGENDEGGR